MGMTVMSSLVWMLKDSTGQTMNQVMTPCQQRFRNPYLYRATLSVWKKVCLCRGIWRILLRAVDQCPKRWPALWLPLSLNDHHRRDLVMKLFWPSVILTWEYVTKYVLCCWNDFWQPCRMGKFYFQMNMQFTADPYLEMFFGAKQNPRYTLEM